MHGFRFGRQGWSILLVISALASILVAWQLNLIWPLILVALGTTAGLLYLGWRQRHRGARSDSPNRWEEQALRLSAIHQVADALSQAVELPELLGHGLEQAVNALGLDGGQIHLLADEGGDTMHRMAVFGDDSHYWTDEQTLQVGECICGQVAADGSPVVVDDLTNDPRVTRSACVAGGVPSIASVPLRIQGGTLGVLTVRSCDPRHFALQDVELLTSIANFMAAAIENARVRAQMKEQIADLTAEVQQLAIVEERERIGREMHDGLAQTLGMLNLQIESVKGAARSEDWPAAEGELALLDHYLSDAYTDVREALSALRNARPAGEDFVTSLEDYLAEFGRKNGLETRLRVENGQGAVLIPPLMEVHLQRVIHEALTNVRRHASANRVELGVIQDQSGWRVVVTDDGCGFDAQRITADDSNQFGLMTMRERVEGIGGEFVVRSKVGEGTQVEAFAPREPAVQG